MNTKKVILRRDILKKTTKEIHSFDSDYLNQEFCLITPDDSNVCIAMEESFKSWSFRSQVFIDRSTCECWLYPIGLRCHPSTKDSI